MELHLSLTAFLKCSHRTVYIVTPGNHIKVATSSFDFVP